MLGCEFEIDGILAGERVSVEVPAGCQYGERVVVSGNGMPRGVGSARGDLVVLVNVVVPDDLSASQREALEAIASERAVELGDPVAAEGDDPARTEGDDEGRRQRRAPRPRKGGKRKGRR